MSILTALLTHDQVVTPRKIDEAIQRQVISGGDIETNLLELGAVAEDTLAAYCAAVYNLDPAPRQDVLDADPVAIARVPRDLATRAQVVPLHTESGVLVLACAKPPSAADLGPVEAMCGMKVVLRVVVPFRLTWAMWRYYQLPFDARLGRLADRQHALPSGVIPKVVRPPALSGVPAETPTVPSMKKGATLSALATLMAALEEDDDEEDSEPERPSIPPVAAAVVVSRPAPVVPVVPPRAIGLSEARERLAAAKTRDAVLEVLLDHTCSSFTYAALLLVHGERCEGFGGRGLGASSEQVRRLSLSLGDPGMIHDVRENSSPVVSRISTAADRALRDGLERGAVTDAALIPMRFGTRTALILWVDKGMSPPSSTLLAPITAFVDECAAALAQIILERKQSSGGRASGAPRPSVILRSGNAPVEGRPSSASITPRPSVRPSRMPPREARLEALRHALSTPAPSLTPAAPSPPSAADNPPGTRPATERPAPVVVVPRPSAAPTTEADRLVVETIESGTLSDATAAALLGQGERALDAIFSHFPGPTTIERTQELTRLPVLSDAGPLLRLVIAFRQASIPRLIAVLDDPESPWDLRHYCALLCLGEVVHPSALNKLTPFLFAPDAAMQAAATEVLRQYRRFAEFEHVGSVLRGLLRDPSVAVDRRRVAAQTIGALRDTQAVTTLIQSLEDSQPGVATASRQALVLLTRQDFGASPPGWSAWWSTASTRHRVEWLIDALLHSDSTIRHEASEELKRVTGQFFGYYFNLPRKERERAHQRYLEWWQREGSARFTGPT